MTRLFLRTLHALFAPLRWAFLPCVTSADLSTLSEIMKEVYDPVIEEQQNLEAMLWREFMDGDDPLGGEGWFFENKMGGNQEGIGARAERGDLPDPGRQRWKQGKIYWKLLYGAFELTGPVIEAAKQNLHAFANARTSEIEGLTRDVIKDFNRQLYGDGIGVLATVTARTSTTVFTVDHGLYLRENMLIEVWDASNPSTRNSNASLDVQITGLSPNADGTVDVTVDQAEANTIAAGDVVLRQGAATPDATPSNPRTDHEMTGIQAAIDDGTNVTTYEDISRTTYPLWKGHYLDNSGTDRNLTLDLMQQAEDMVSRAAGKRPNWIRMNQGQRRKFFDLVSPDRRYNTSRFDAGYEKLEFNGLDLTVDIDCPLGKVFFCTKESFRKYTLRKMGLLDFDGLTLRQVSGKDVWRGYVGMYGNLGCKRPNCNAQLLDLVEPTMEAWVW